MTTTTRTVAFRLEGGRQKPNGVTYQLRGYASNKDRKNKGKMPPKKQVEEKKVMLGRPGNSLKSGIVCTNMCVLLRVDGYAWSAGG